MATETAAWPDRVSRDAIVDTARSLIAIPSLSGNEKDVMDFVVRWCEQRGIKTTVTAKDPARPNVIAWVGDPESGPVIAMNGHLDTVPVSDPKSWKSDPFDPVVSEDGQKLYGRGASDMKSSVGVMLTMLDLFRNARIEGALMAHIVSDEELSANYGTLHVLDEIEAGRLPRPDYVFIGEGSQLKVRNAERGILAFRVTVIGKASHTAVARVSGINAIAKAARAVLELEGDINKFHPSIGHPVISINTIEGGVAHNVVPGDCTFTIDRRLIPGETRESVTEEIREILDGIAAEDPDFRYELEVDPDGGYIPANITEVDSPLVKAFQRSIRTVLNQEPEYFVQWAGATDGRFYRKAGIDTVGMGASGENAHGANEAANIDDLVLQGKIYAQTIADLLNAR
ncbi:MAG: ArgE/DapE family deacylase [Chloroflexota bacterium]|nr:ArgE/DapE family deacylase [Chloroflexota bacterium]